MSKKVVSINPKTQVGRPKNKSNLAVDKRGDIIPGTYKTPMGEVKIKKIQPATKYDVINVARAMNEDSFAPKLKELFTPEQEACEEAIRTGLYVSYRPIDSPYNQQDCIRISNKGRCFCSHSLCEHDQFTGKQAVLKCKHASCPCKAFAWVPSRPEESGEFWLRKRRDFVASEYRARCRCRHSHEEHRAHPPPHRCAQAGCGCSMFNSAFVCAGCDLHWHRHRTVLETESERRAAGRPVGHDWLPFSEMPNLRDMAITGEDNPNVTSLEDALPNDLREKLQLQRLQQSASGRLAIDNNAAFQPPKPGKFRPVYD